MEILLTIAAFVVACAWKGVADARIQRERTPVHEERQEDKKQN